MLTFGGGWNPLGRASLLLTEHALLGLWAVRVSIGVRCLCDNNARWVLRMGFITCCWVSSVLRFFFGIALVHCGGLFAGGWTDQFKIGLPLAL